MLNPRGMEPDPSLETCTQSRAETEGERTETREGPTRSPSPLSPNRFSSAHNLTTPPKLNPPRPSKLTLTPSASTLTLTPSASTLTLTPSASTLTLTPSASTLTLTSTCTPSSSSTPTPNPLKLNPTPSPPPTLTHKTLTTLTPMVLNPTPTCTPTSPSLTPNPVTPTILIPNPTPPTLTPSLPTPTHAPTKVTHKPVPFPLTPPTIHFTSPLLTPSRSSPTVSAITSLPPSSVNHSNMSSAPGTSSLTNGNARPVPTPTSPPITPFHTPASRQIHFPRPLDTPTLVQAYQSTSSVRQRVSQQALLLGRSSCSSRDQMLLRTQMLQSLTLHPSAPGTLTIPPSLRLKPPSSSSHSPISRPRTPLFPPLRPRPQPSAMVTDRQTTPTRHLSVPPPTLYSSVRSVPLRPRLHSPNGHRVASPRHSPALQPIAAAAARQALPSRQWTGPASSLSSQTPPTQTTPGQSQLSSGSSPLGSTSCFDRLPPASRQLQIIALSAGSTHRLSSQLQPAANTHTPTSIQSKHLVLESPPPQLDAQPQRTSEHASPSPTSSIHKANTPLPYLHYQARHTDPKGEVGRQGVREERERVGLDEEMMGGIEEEQRNRERVGGDRQVTGEEKGNVDKRGERVGGQEKEGTGGEETWMERVKGFETLRELTEVEEGQERMKIEGEEQRERMEVEEGQERMKIEGDEQRERMEVEEEKQRERMEVEEQEQGQKDAMKGEEGTTIDPQLNPDPATQNPPSEPPINIQRPSDRPIEQSPDLPHVDQEDLCENMFNQSDNQSVLSSLSSQSPPASPFLTLSSDLPPPLLPVSPSHPESLSLSQSRPETFSLLERKPWSQRVWPEGGRRVLTHLVEGFIIQEGLQAFPVNRSSLLLGGQEAISQNGNIEGAELLPLTDTPEPPEHSSESEQERVATSDPLTGPRERHRGVLHCESCGKRGHAHSFHRSKRYCSTSCARRYNVGLSKRLRALSAGSQPEGRRSEMNKVESVPGKPLLLRLPREIWSAHRRDNEEEEGHAVPTAARLERRVARRARRASEPAMTPGNSTVTSSDSLPAQWSVEQVWDFIHTLPGCVEVAEAFRVQEIDGQALLLLTEDHLMTSMNIKLGPALKICAHINTLRHR